MSNKSAYNKKGTKSGQTKYQQQSGVKTSIKSMRVSLLDEAVDRKLGTQKIIESMAKVDNLDSTFGFDRLESGTRVGWLFNLVASSSIHDDLKVEQSAVDLYFIENDGSTFKATYIYKPYFYVGINKESNTVEMESFLLRKFEGMLESVASVGKEDLELNNHLSGLLKTYIKLSFYNINDLNTVKRTLMSKVFYKRSSNTALTSNRETYQSALEDTSGLGLGTIHGLEGISAPKAAKTTDYLEWIVDIREHDVNYVVRASIDNGFRVGLWYSVTNTSGVTQLFERKDLLERPEPRVLAFDIETTKSPLKFPDANVDRVMMISYMIDGTGYLIVNREIVSEDIADFEYNPKPEFPGPFHIFNEPTELATLQCFFNHIREIRPTIYVTYNGDFFDWPFIDKRCSFYGLSLDEEIGIVLFESEYRGRFSVHIDCFLWVKRDSYLPQGSQGLKAVTKAKLKYEPLELDPEDMMPFAHEKPQVLASYSVSDAVATYYLYMTYVHLFIFSLCTIIPMPPADVLRKGSGTLCEQLLMVEAYVKNIICPNKQKQNHIQFYNGHLLESETYIGGHVQSLEPGVFRDDIPCDFQIDPTCIQELIDSIDKTLHFALVEEAKIPIENVTNYDEIKSEIISKLIVLRDKPNSPPLIYHLDVAAMYPNIILTNRLQPMAIVTEEQCAACDYNRPANKCQRPMTWMWRGEYFPSSRADYEAIRTQIEYDVTTEHTYKANINEDDDDEEQPSILNKFNKYSKAKSFADLPEDQQAEKIKSRMKDYCRKVYRKVHDKAIEERKATICQRENPFYVDTVKAFRDRRYEYKTLNKVWKDNLKNAKNAVDIVQCKNMVLLYDSLQLAHKCILNSFYGYVMRTGARWHSMEMAGVVTKTGTEIIKDATRLVERLGRPLELDTDGIWCIIPNSFPENFIFKTNLPNQPKAFVSYPCSMLNILVHNKYTNDQYQTLVNGKYEISKECSIFFEIDGPYRAMILPASQDEGRNLKKRYAVFNKDGSIAELKGFELKRRGELKLIKIFQKQIFDKFLDGGSLQECYNAVASAGNHWLDVLYSKGKDLPDNEVFELISESRNMSCSLAEYGDQKGHAITTAQRLSQFLGAEMVKDKGLACKYIISKLPIGEAVSSRAVPVAIFNADESVKKKYIRAWLKDSAIVDFDIRNILDWDYYIGRLGSTIQKIITIPAALQSIKNPVPRVPHPDWLHSRIKERNALQKQTSIGKFFKKLTPEEVDRSLKVADMEDIGRLVPLKKTALITKVVPEVPKVIEIIPPFCSITTNTAKWLEFAKYTWAGQLADRKRKSDITSLPDSFLTKSINKGKPNIRDGLNSYIQQSQTNIFQKPWHIISTVMLPSSPNSLLVWVFLDSSVLQAITVKIEPKMYINVKNSKEESLKELRKVVRTLPRGAPSFNVYETGSLPEELPADSIAGVYESKIPSISRFIIEAGCVCKVNINRYKVDLSKKSTNPLSLSHLDIFTSDVNPYLSQAVFRKIYIYWSFASDGRATVTVILETSKNTTGIVMIVNPFRGAIFPDIPASVFQNNSQINFSTSGFPNLPFNNFNYLPVNSLTTAFNHVSSIFTDYRTKYSGPCVIYTQNVGGSKELMSLLPRVIKEFPVIEIPFHKEDNDYELFQWENKAIKNSILRQADLLLWFESQLSLCRYAQIPIGNLTSDHYSYVTDIIFSRHLKYSNHMLWYSEADKPDLGGMEDDENFFSDEHINPEVCFPSCIRTFSVELDMKFLAVNTLLKLSVLEEIEGNDLSEVQIEEKVEIETNIAPSSRGRIEDKNSTRSAIKILCGLVSTWFNDVKHNKNIHADALLSHLYRWLRSPSSRLYDPALHRYVHVLMKKIFLQLLAEFKKLGAKVVYASFGKLIMATPKVSMSNALSYTQFIFDTILNRKLFEWIQLIPVNLYENLLFMDAANFGAIVKRKEGGDDMKDDDVIESSAELQSSWNIASYLPPVAGESFEKIISELIWTPYMHLQQLQDHLNQKILESAESSKQNRVQETPLKIKKREIVASPLVSQIDVNKNASLEVFMVELVSKTLAHEIMGIVLSLKSMNSDTSVDSDMLAFPFLPGSHLNLANPALEFINYVCHVISLDPLAVDHVANLRSNALRLINCRPFAAECTFKNPCHSFVMPDIICTFCNHCRDIDLCRDPDLLENLTEWKCSCGQPYDRNNIEQNLVALANRRCVSFHLQDLICVRCNQVQSGNMKEFCSCSGSLKTYEPISSIQKSLMMFLNIAKYYKFELLRESVEWLLSN